MLDTTLEWVKALGLGSLIGVFIGARLTRGVQDRQFTRQQVAQRVDRARTAFQEAEVIGYKLMTMLAPIREVAGARILQKLAEVPGLNQDMLGAAVRLRSDGASDVARAFDHAWTTAQTMYNRIAGTADLLDRADYLDAADFSWHLDKVKQLAFALDQARGYWVDWLAQQESMHTRAPRNWLPWRNRTADVVVEVPKARPPQG